MTKPPIFKIRARDPESVMSPSNCLLTMNDIPLPLVRKFTFEVDVNTTVAKITMEFAGVVDIEAMTNLVSMVIPETEQ